MDPLPTTFRCFREREGEGDDEYSRSDDEEPEDRSPAKKLREDATQHRGNSGRDHGPENEGTTVSARLGMT